MIQHIAKSPPFSKTLWLVLCSLLVIGMIVLGGVTRLTESGLSIVEWKPITGIIPPLSKAAWTLEFEHYKQFPEYKLKHADLTLDAFKFIFYMEYSHRLLGRCLGIVFFVPLFFFWRKCTPLLKRKLIVIACVGALQGGMGWFMVKSGLVHNPYVSHYRLALHLVLAFALIALFLTAILETGIKIKMPSLTNKHLNLSLKVALLCVGLTIIYGAFVAGLRAGHSYNTFPKMGEEWLPSEWLFYSPWYTNFLENPATIQWVHRCLAFVSLAMIAWTSVILFQAGYRKTAIILIITANLQTLLGIVTVILSVPIWLGILHQLNAVLLFSYLIYLWRASDEKT